MLKRFDKETYTWEGVEKLVYKQDNSPFKDVTRQILFDGLADIPCQFRYFEVQPGGYSTLEHHEHVHLVMIFRGKGQVLLGKEVKDTSVGDVIVIPPQMFHQFRANKGEALGFLCLVNVERDKVKLPTEEEWKDLVRQPEIKNFLEEK